MNAKHTPGPWKVRVAGTMTGRGPEVYQDEPYYEDGSEFVVADCGCSEVSDRANGKWKRTEEADAIEANGRLIAAAPDLLAALANLVGILDRKTSATAVEKTYVMKARAALARAKGGAA